MLYFSYNIYIELTTLTTLECFIFIVFVPSKSRFRNDSDLPQNFFRSQSGETFYENIFLMEKLFSVAQSSSLDKKFIWGIGLLVATRALVPCCAFIFGHFIMKNLKSYYFQHRRAEYRYIGCSEDFMLYSAQSILFMPLLSRIKEWYYFHFFLSHWSDCVGRICN